MHKNILQNQNKQSKAVNELRSHHRLLLTGTPVMNKLTDFWSLVSFFSSGELLGSRVEFKRDFEK